MRRTPSSWTKVGFAGRRRVRRSSSVGGLKDKGEPDRCAPSCTCLPAPSHHLSSLDKLRIFRCSRPTRHSSPRREIRVGLGNAQARVGMPRSWPLLFCHVPLTTPVSSGLVPPVRSPTAEPSALFQYTRHPTHIVKLEPCRLFPARPSRHLKKQQTAELPSPVPSCRSLSSALSLQTSPVSSSRLSNTSSHRLFHTPHHHVCRPAVPPRRLPLHASGLSSHARCGRLLSGVRRAESLPAQAEVRLL